MLFLILIFLHKCPTLFFKNANTMAKVGLYDTSAITYQGHTKSLSEWCELYRMPYKLIRDRLEFGMTMFQAMNKEKPLSRHRPYRRPIRKTQLL